MLLCNHVQVVNQLAQKIYSCCWRYLFLMQLPQALYPHAIASSSELKKTRLPVFILLPDLHESVP